MEGKGRGERGRRGVEGRSEEEREGRGEIFVQRGLLFADMRRPPRDSRR